VRVDDYELRRQREVGTADGGLPDGEDAQVTVALPASLITSSGPELTVGRGRDGSGERSGAVQQAIIAAAAKRPGFRSCRGSAIVDSTGALELRNGLRACS